MKLIPKHKKKITPIANPAAEKKLLEKSDTTIRSQKNRIARSEAHHRRRSKKKELQKQERARKKQIEKKTGKKLPTIPLKDMEDEHKDKVRIEKIISTEKPMDEPEALPKILLTTCKKPIKAVNYFVRDLKKFIPNAKVYKRRDYPLVDICVYANEENFTHVISVTQSHGKVVGLTISYLRENLTAHFRVSSVVLCTDIPNHAEWTAHYPELFFKSFDTTIGERTKTILQSIFPAARDYKGRAVVTFLNKRDFIFVRAHRYIFDGLETVSIQELGPRFTLKLQKLTERRFTKEAVKQGGNVIWASAKEKSKRDLVM